MDVYTNTGTIKSVALSPNGDRVLYKFTPAYNAPDATNLYVDDVASGSNLFSIQSIAPIRNAAEWSADGRCFAFVTTTNFVSEDDGTNKVYLCDLQTGTITLIGASGPSTGSLAALSDAPAMSDDGRFIAYRSSMTNTMPGDANPPPNIFLFDRVTGLTTVLTAAQTGSSPILWASRPAISSSGNTVAFLSLGSGLVSGDLNRVQDAFASLVDTGAARVDTDADGIPDWWMLKYFGHATGQVSDLSRAGDDADGDGVSNLREFLAGTVPTDSTSIFQVQLSAVALTNGTVNSVNLSWPTVPGKNYQVQYKVNLSDPVWMDASGGALVLGNQGSLSLPVTQPNCFYRVVAMQ
jgi:Tol biopolymer transport system component